MTTIVFPELSETRSTSDSKALCPNQPRTTPSEETFNTRNADTLHVGVGILPVIWRKLALFVVGLAAILGATELALRMSNHHAVAAASSIYRVPAPFIEFYQRPNASGPVSTNEEGFRYGHLPLAKPPGEIRVFFLSSSLGFNGSSNATTIAGFMERQLSEYRGLDESRIRVINASGVSFIPTQSLVLLVTRLLSYSPDVIVIFHGTETLFYPTHFEDRRGYPFNFNVREHMHGLLTGKIEEQNPFIAYLQGSAIVSYFHPNLAISAKQSQLMAKSNLARIDTLEQYDPYIDQLSDDVQKMARIASAYGCRTLVSVPPAQESSFLPGAVERMAERIRTTVETKLPSTARYVDTTHLRDVFTTKHLWCSDPLHWRDAANELIAEQLTEALIAEGLID